MASFSVLPFEIIENILNSECISGEDICRISCVSQAFNIVSKSNKLWEKKYEQRWPDLFPLFPSDTDWRNEYRLRFHHKVSVAQKLDILSEEYYHQDNVSNDAFFQIHAVCEDHPFAYNILIDELECIINDPNSHLNLTQKYYAKRALRFIRHKQLEVLWRKFLAQPVENISLIEGACMISQWCQPTSIHCTKDVIPQLNDIVDLVFAKVKAISPRHPVVARGLLLPSENISSSLWASSECKIILSCINTVIFEELKYFGNREDFYCAENTFIDKVLQKKTGIPITLSIVYHYIAARLGVACLPVSFPGQFLLKWLEHTGRTDNEAYTFIDVFEKGALKSLKDLDDLVPGYDNFNSSWYEAVPPVKVFIRMCWNLVEVGRQMDGIGAIVVCLCNALELLSIINPDDMEHKLLLARVYMHLSINTSDVISLLQEISAQDPMAVGIVGYMYQSALCSLENQKTKQSVKIKVQYRGGYNKEVKYAVGMIMKHKKYGYRCVIYGWDNVCTASKDWIRQMGVSNLSNKEKQPFYHVLVNDGTNRYAAQENLKIDDSELPVQHIEVGRFFESYHGNHYLANKQKMIEYPQDFKVLKELLNITETMECK
ncbi:F-box only protein 21-like isoform X1 [Uloborus diversus]|uniref:F-box only protein 21-like isoform X1 n=1 Tax=Uloborus diversus TaxID=327109 RepID=UPI00240902DC|nr:F-box only protein 21-like isoform X1 [Uloborus diversus]